MYKPPENANRVQAIRSIFEGKEAATPPKLITKSKTELNIRYSKCHQNLNRQLSDPSKRNIKRTPAFRLDKNAIAENRYQSKVKHDCDKTKSKCLEDEALSFSDIRSKFSRNNNNSEIESDMTSTNVENISFLYAKPIPKSLRINKRDATTKSDEDDYHSKETLKLRGDDSVSLTDTIKSALKKPLPSGPAPKKPPRTFLHSPHVSKETNASPLHADRKFVEVLNKKLEKNTPRGKGDPKYMLDKLENMLKKKQSRCRKAGRTDSEDSDDNNTIRKSSKTNNKTLMHNTSNTLPNSSSQLFNLNCLNALGCNASTYECIKEPNSSFFIECQKEEPLYAEPFQFRRNMDQAKEDDSKNTNTGQRNSLYYMVCLLMIFFFPENNYHCVFYFWLH